MLQFGPAITEKCQDFSSAEEVAPRDDGIFRHTEREIIAVGQLTHAALKIGAGCPALKSSIVPVLVSTTKQTGPEVNIHKARFEEAGQTTYGLLCCRRLNESRQAERAGQRD